MLDWRWDFTWDILPRLLAATGNTLLAAGLGYFSTRHFASGMTSGTCP